MEPDLSSKKVHGREEKDTLLCILIENIYR
jgi:hypothetical protein